MKAVVYARFSSDNQREESIDAQLRAIREYADKHGVIIVKEYIDEAKSATTDDRPQFLQMIEDITTGKVEADYCYVHKLDRFARNRYDSAIYRRKLITKGVRLLAVAQPLDDSPESIILEAMLESMAEYYSKNLSREVMKGMQENALKAQHCGGKPPLGYDLDENNHYIINEREAEAVRLIFTMKASGYGYSSMMNELNKKGFRTKRGKTFCINSIHDILVNEKYTGTFIYNRLASKHSSRLVNSPDKIIKIPNAIPQIIDSNTWKVVQSMIENNKQTNPRQRGEVIYLLTGKLECGVCGGAYVGNGRFSGRLKKKYYLYACNVRQRTKDRCNNPEIRKEIIEQHVLDEIQRIFFSGNAEEWADKLLALYTEKNAGFAEQKKNINQQIQNLSQKIDRLYEAVENGLANQDTYERIKNAIKERELLESGLQSLEANYQVPYTKNQILAYIEENRQALTDRSDLESCKLVINRFVEKVIIAPDDIYKKYRFGVDVDNHGSPNGIRTRVSAVRGRCPRPLDDRTKN
jgi:site-specific DNA recombinase